MFDPEDWFSEFIGWLRKERSRVREMLEALSDATNEFYCNATAARHLREYGRERAKDGHFWARTEWKKRDISYGHASARFATWDKSTPDRTGILGTIEAKVLYAHWSPSQMRAPVKHLASTLEAQRSRPPEARASLRG